MGTQRATSINQACTECRHIKKAENMGYNSSRKNRVKNKRKKIAASRERKRRESLEKKKS
jgi:hypothetical protein